MSKTASILSWVLVILLALLAWNINATKNEEIAKLELNYSRQLTHQTEALAAEQAKARSAETDLQANADTIHKETNETIDNLRASRDALTHRLRIAEANLATANLISQTNPATYPGQTPGIGNETQFPATIGAEDVGEAFRADQIRIALLACYRQYDAAQATLAGQTK